MPNKAFNPSALEDARSGLTTALDRTMTIWRIQTLLHRLRQGQLTARQMLLYLIAATVSATLIFVFTDWSRPWDRDEFETGVDSLTTLMNGTASQSCGFCCATKSDLTRRA